MALTPSQYLDLVAPEFSSNANKSTYLEMAQGRTSSCFYGSNYSQAVALMAAHMMALALSRPAGGDAGQVTSKREGDLSISFGAVSGVSADLAQTKYGVQLAGLRRASGPALGVTGGGLVC